MTNHSIRKIWKYPIEITEKTVLKLPYNSRFLSVIEQDNKPVLYFRVNPEEPRTDHLVILLYGTGQPLDLVELHAASSLGTVTTHQGKLVWHLFMRLAHPKEHPGGVNG